MCHLLILEYETFGFVLFLYSLNLIVKGLPIRICYVKRVAITR